jgi:hypothetical protein
MRKDFRRGICNGQTNNEAQFGPVPIVCPSTARAISHERIHPAGFSYLYYLYRIAAREHDAQ